MQRSRGAGSDAGAASKIANLAVVIQPPANGLTCAGCFQVRPCFTRRKVTGGQHIKTKTGFGIIIENTIAVIGFVASITRQLIKAAQHLDGANGSADAVVACKPGVARKHNHTQGGHGKNGAVDNLPAGSLNKRLGVLLGI